MKRPQLINIVDVICHSFRHLDPRLTNHGERVAYIIMKMLEETRRYTPQEKQDILMLGLLHDIGAYKDSEIDSMLRFDLNDTMEHSVFGYLLFKTFSPLPQYADVILYHHNCNAQYYPVPISSYHRDIAKLIYLADRIDIFCVLNSDKNLNQFLEKYSSSRFLPSDIRWFWAAEEKHHILEHIRSMEYQKELSDFTRNYFTLAEDRAHNYLMTFIFSIDFRNEHTALHTDYAVHLSENIANTLGLPADSRSAIQLAALLQNIGKVSLHSCLSGSKDYRQYLTELYQHTTLDVTKEILTGIIDQKILEIIEESFRLLECWSQNRPVTFLPAPDAEIVALSYLMSNSLSQEMNVSRCHHPRMLSFLRKKYQTCGMNDHILQTLEDRFDQIIEKTQTSCSSTYSTFQQITEENHSLNMILMHYNNKY